MHHVHKKKKKNQSKREMKGSLVIWLQLLLSSLFSPQIGGGKSIRISSAKISCVFYTKNLLFLFYIPTSQNPPHQSIYYTIYFI